MTLFGGEILVFALVIPWVVARMSRATVTGDNIAGQVDTIANRALAVVAQRVPFVNYVVNICSSIRTVNTIFKYILGKGGCCSCIWILGWCLVWIIFAVSFAIPKSTEYFGIDTWAKTFDKSEYFDLVYDTGVILQELQHEYAYTNPRYDATFFVARLKAGLVESYGLMVKELRESLKDHPYVNRRDENRLKQAVGNLWTEMDVFGCQFHGGEGCGKSTSLAYVLLKSAVRPGMHTYNPKGWLSWVNFAGDYVFHGFKGGENTDKQYFHVAKVSVDLARDVPSGRQILDKLMYKPGDYDPARAIGAAAAQLEYKLLLWVHVEHLNEDAFVKLVKFARSLKMVSHDTRTIIETSHRDPVVTSEFAAAHRFTHIPWYPVDKDEIDTFLKAIDPKANFEHVLQLTGGLPKQLFDLVNAKTKERFLRNKVMEHYNLWDEFDADFWKETIMPHCVYYDSFTMGNLLTIPIQHYVIKLETLGGNETVNAMLKVLEKGKVIRYDENHKRWDFVDNGMGYLLCEKESSEYVLQSNER